MGKEKRPCAAISSQEVRYGPGLHPSLADAGTATLVGCSTAHVRARQPPMLYPYTKASWERAVRSPGVIERVTIRDRDRSQAVNLGWHRIGAVLVWRRGMCLRDEVVE